MLSPFSFKLGLSIPSYIPQLSLLTTSTSLRNRLTTPPSYRPYPPDLIHSTFLSSITNLSFILQLIQSLTFQSHQGL